jgi:U3 small nucleolar RNA-associated protein 20
VIATFSHFGVVSQPNDIVSHKQQSSQIFLQYLLEYPMGKQRMDSHLNQIVLNIKYEYEEGRLAAIGHLSSVIQKFPLPVLELRCQFFFLPLTLQLVNDDSKTCKEAVADCISLLLQRLSTESAQSLFVYAKRWSQSSGAHSLPMQRASAQLLGVFVDSRPDYVKRGNNASDIIFIVQEVVTKQDLEDQSGWELLYHYLICTEKLQKRMPAILQLTYELWGSLVSLMAFPHPWVMQVSSRIISSHMSEIDPNRLMHDAPQSFIVNIPGCLYKIARNSCRQLDDEDVHFVEATSTIAIKTITWAFRAMKQHQSMLQCFPRK